ncbi:MAG: hypothetical protein U0903_10595 [Planctomycetales bacterium]
MDEFDPYKEWLGIPEGPRPPDHYALLRLVMFEDSPEKIRNNYKKLNGHVRKYATGKHSVRSQELLNELAKAMLCLEDVERKREYDESLGREFEEVQATGLKTFEQILMEKKLITRDQVKEAKVYADKLGIELRDAVVQMKMVEATPAAEALAMELGLPFVDLADMTPDDSVLDRVPKILVKTHSILPLFIDDDKLLVACVNPPTHELEDELRMRFEQQVRCVLATPLAINQGIAKYYAPGARQEVVVEVSKPGKTGAPTKSGGGAKPKKSVADMTPDEIRNKRLIAMMVPFWTAIACVGIDIYLIAPRGSAFPYRLTLVLPALVGYWVWAVYLKRLPKP